MISKALKRFAERALPAVVVLTHTILLESGNAAAATAKSERTYRTAEVTLAFDQVNPLAEQWAFERGTGLIQEISEPTKRNIRSIVALAFDQGIAPRRAARLIRSHIGLTVPQSTSLRARAELQGWSDDKLERELSKALRRRSVVIARTETIAASNEGQRQLWIQAKQMGLLVGTELREWIVTPDDRLCPICAPMAGQLRGMDDDPFESPTNGARRISPPIHPQCRCAVGLTNTIENICESPCRSRNEVGGVFVPPARRTGPLPKSKKELLLSGRESQRAFDVLKEGFQGVSINASTPDELNSEGLRSWAKNLIERRLGFLLGKTPLSEDQLLGFIVDTAQPGSSRGQFGYELFGEKTIEKLLKSIDAGTFDSKTWSMADWVLLENVLSKQVETVKDLVKVDTRSFLTRHIVRALTYSWAATAGGHPQAVGIQLIANEVFKLKAKTSHLFRKLEDRFRINLSPGQSSVTDIAENWADVNFPLVSTFLNEMYQETQRTLERQGIDYLTLFRGANKGSGGIVDFKSSIGNISMQPLNSFSTDVEQALKFSEGRVMAVRVPAGHILCNSRTGFGCLNEGEYVVLGGGWQSSFLDGFSVAEINFDEIDKDTAAILAKQIGTFGGFTGVDDPDFKDYIEVGALRGDWLEFILEKLGIGK